MQLSENKTSIIKNRLLLPDIPDRSEKDKFKDLLIGFFKRHPNYENKIDWNKARTLTKADFDEVLSLEGSLSGEENAASTEKNILDIFKSVKGRKFEIVGENSRWLFVAPLNWEAAVYCDSSENQGAGAKWCIGQEDNNSFWYKYILEGSVFVMAFNKNYRNLSKDDLKIQLKYMVERKSNGSYHVWNQIDTDTGSNLEVVGYEKTVADGMFKKAKESLSGEIDSLVSKATESIGTLISDNVEENGSISRGAISYEYKMAVSQIRFPDNVVEIPSYMFMECSRLESIVFPTGLEYIGRLSFVDCKKLKSIEFLGKSLKVEPDAFDHCSRNLVVTVPNGFDRNCLKNVHFPKATTFRILDN